MTQSLENRWYGFEEEERYKLCEHSNSLVSEYEKYVKKTHKNVVGLLYEIRQVEGNWTFKDRVLPGLFGELNSILSETLKKIEKYEEKLPESLEWEGFRSKTRNQKLFLLGYLITRLKKEFLEGSLSGRYTHLCMKKAIRRYSIRIDKVFEDLICYTGQLLLHFARKGINEIIISNIKRNTLPLICKYEEIFNTVFYWAYSLNELKNRLMGCFRPDVGNGEYWIGMKPIWEDSRIRAYHFNYTPNICDNKENYFILITDDFNREFQHRNIWQYEKRTVLELFEKEGKKDLFLNWFMSKPVKTAILRNISIGFISNVEHEKITSQFQKTSYALREILKDIKAYYGVTYTFNEARAILIKDFLRMMRRWNYKEEYKTIYLRRIGKLFPKWKFNLVPHQEFLEEKSE